MTTKDFILNLDKNFDEKIGIFVHHHGASYNPTVNLNNYETYIPNALSMVQDLGINNIEVPFTHVSNYDNEFVVIMQYLVDKALELGMTVMVIANGNMNAMTPEQIETDSNNYLNVMTQFVQNNVGKGIIYEGLNEPDNGTWYGQKNWDGYNASFEWSKKLHDAVKTYDPDSAFMGGVMDPTLGAKAWRDGRIVGDIYAYHPYLHEIGQKGSTTPESQLLEATFTLGLDGKPFALTEFGISAQNTEQDAEADWQGMVSPELAGAYLVRQLIIQDYFNAPIQYTFILGYYYDFKRFRMFDLDGNITPTGTALKQCILELKGYKFDKWLYANHDGSGIYVVRYSKDGEYKYVYWNSTSSNIQFDVNGTILTTSPIPKFTTELSEPPVKPLVIRTPYGLYSLDTGLGIGEIKYITPPYFVNFISNPIYVKINIDGDVELLNNLFYNRLTDNKYSVSAKNIFSYTTTVRIKSPSGYIFRKTVENSGKINYIKE